ncbi:hypothetical protein ABN296_24010, partial [Enterobacter hormaechei]
MGDICLKKYGLPCTFANEHASFPMHAVTLDSFYIAKHKVTYMDYDLYTNNKGLPELKVDAEYLEDYPKLRDSNLPATAGNDSNLLIVFYVQIMPDDFVMQLHR